MEQLICSDMYKDGHGARWVKPSGVLGHFLVSIILFQENIDDQGHFRSVLVLKSILMSLLIRILFCLFYLMDTC